MTWHLAQINVGNMVAPQGDPRVAPFFEALDRINADADRSPGFVWRLQSDSGNATDIRPTDDPLFLVNMSVWTDADSLFAYVYRSAHTREMAKRREYFHRFGGAHQALCWIRAGTIPSVDDGLSRLWRLDRFGPTAQAFTFKNVFPRPDTIAQPSDLQPDPWCIALDVRARA